MRRMALEVLGVVVGYFVAEDTQSRMAEALESISEALNGNVFVMVSVMVKIVPDFKDVCAI